MNRLDRSTLELLPPSVARPAYSPTEHRSGIVHLGTGAFHRAHQAVYTDAALEDSGGDWRIIGSSLRSPEISGCLNGQDGLYSVVSRDSEVENIRVIGAIERVIYAPDQAKELIDNIASPKTRIVTLTVTEKGYCYDPATQALDESNAQVKQDLKTIGAPQTAPGFIVAGLRKRHESGAGPVTVLSCDNLPHNGNVTRSVVAQLADAVDPALARWIKENVTFPSSMVDRITPATTDADLKHVETELGVSDLCPVVTEAFSQWVVEDDFAVGRPAWEAGGATFVADVEPFEKMKLRLLNGSHSTIAYLGCLAGIDYVHEVIANAPIRSLIRKMMDREISPTLSGLDFDLEAYKDNLMRRFANSSLSHATRQIAMDGSQKLPQRLLEPIRERLEAGQPVDCMTLSIAAWMLYVGGGDARDAYEIDDPLASQFAEVRQRHAGEPQMLASGLLAIRPIFGDQLPANPEFVRCVTQSLSDLLDLGVAGAIDSTLQRVAGIMRN